MQIHALTGWSRADDGRVAVFDRYLVKPVMRSTFAAILREPAKAGPGRRVTDIVRAVAGR